MKRRPSALNYQVELVGVLTREVSTRLVEISRGGCLLESSKRIEEGTVATLRLDVRGQTYTEEVRATRCVAVAGSGSSYLIGIEFLKTGAAHEMSIRRALAGSLGPMGDNLPSSWGSVSL
jgi:PilZ domain-containing protein